MRAASLALLAALVADGFGWSAQAQTAPQVPQPASAKPKDGDKASQNLGSQNPKETGTDHVDALSRDETRRLERLRARTKPASKGQEVAAPAKPELAKRDANAPSPAATAKTEPMATRRARTSSSSNAPRRTREASEPHRSRGKAASRSVEREVADRAPRVGDVVPPNVPLYPLGSSYGGRSYPPFPSVNGYTPRRVFVEPD